MIPLHRIVMGQDAEAAVLDVLRSGHLAMGSLTDAFEDSWARYCGARRAVLMANGTVALEALLTALGIGPGDEVITVSFTFNATVSAILRVGATPVFVDVRESDFTMDPALVAAAITPRTRAILPVHLYGQMADVPAIHAAAGSRIPVIEDAAQAHGAQLHGRAPGAGGYAVYSLYATKNLPAGEGGVVVTDDDDVAQRLRLYRNHGAELPYFHRALATNARPTELTAALALVGLRHLDERNARRRMNAAVLGSTLHGYNVPRVLEGRLHAWHLYTMRFPGERARVAAELGERGIGTGIYYPVPAHKQPYLASSTQLPVTEQLSRDVLSIPVRPELTDDELGRVVEAVLAVARPAEVAA